ncbi:MAG: CotH kinase family protein, partial [Planctomycetota bacterium]
MNNWILTIGVGIAGVVALFGAEPPSRPAVEISEIACFGDGDVGEFLELVNRSDVAVDLSGWRGIRGVSFEIAAGVKLSPGEYVILRPRGERDRRASEGRVVAHYDGHLDGDGELVRVVSLDGSTVCDVRYGVQSPWPKLSYGARSLQRPDLSRDVDDPGAWVAAPPTPGRTCAKGVRAEVATSIYSVGINPSRLRPSEAFTIRANVYGDVTRVWVDCVIGTNVRSIEMRRLSAEDLGMGRANSPDATYEARVAEGLPALTLMRYVIHAEAVSGAATRNPPADAATPNYALMLRESNSTARKGGPTQYSLTISPDVFLSLRRSVYRDTMYESTFLAGDRVFDRVKIRYRGAWARTWPKKSWKIVLPSDQRFEGRRRINLNSAWHDPSFLREPIAHSVYQDCGAFFLKTRMVKLDVNGEFFGLFVEVEQPRGDLAQRCGARGGTIYKASSPRKLSNE